MVYVRTYESCLAYTWHELARGALFEGEDWQGDLAGREEWEVPELAEAEREGEGLRDALHVLDGLAVGESPRFEDMWRAGHVVDRRSDSAASFSLSD